MIALVCTGSESGKIQVSKKIGSNQIPSINAGPSLFFFRKMDSNILIIVLPPSHFVCHLFHFEMSQIIVLFLKIRVINLLMFLLYPYLLMFLLIIQFFDKFI